VLAVPGTLQRIWKINEVASERVYALQFVPFPIRIFSINWGRAHLAPVE